MTIISARRAAENLIEQLRIEFSDRRPVVDVDRIADHLHIPILRDTIPDDQHGSVSGMLITRARRSMIVINKEHVPSRQRFTIAHELGHAVLRHAMDDVHVDGGFAIHKRSLRSSTGTDYREIEANQFAASLLMPAAFVHQAVEVLPGPSLRDVDVEALCARFGVSEQAMLIRLSVLGLND